MKSWIVMAALALSGLTTVASWAQVPASAPAGTTGMCQDGSFTSNATKRGACAGHKGVKTWYAAAPAAAPAASATMVAAPAVKPATTAAKPAAPAAAGDVWVNTASKVYHCPGTHWYGKTKEGQYMSEAAAKAAGNRPDHGKACS